MLVNSLLVNSLLVNSLPTDLLEKGRRVLTFCYSRGGPNRPWLKKRHVSHWGLLPTLVKKASRYSRGAPTDLG